MLYPSIMQEYICVCCWYVGNEFARVRVTDLQVLVLLRMNLANRFTNHNGFNPFNQAWPSSVPFNKLTCLLIPIHGRSMGASTCTDTINQWLSRSFLGIINQTHGQSHPDHQFLSSGGTSPPACICLYIHCQFSGLTSPPRALITDPPLHAPTLQHSSRGSPFTSPYRNPLANRSPAPVASTALLSPMAGT